jgi:hypothetical protein
VLLHLQERAGAASHGCRRHGSAPRPLLFMKDERGRAHI